ncbi:hypothetical protein ACTXT7_001781 [Hymenolepis weldensis]
MTTSKLQLYQGYKPTIYYPRSPSKQLYKNLVTQCEKMGIAFLSYIPSDLSSVSYTLRKTDSLGTQRNSGDALVAVMFPMHGQNSAELGNNA